MAIFDTFKKKEAASAKSAAKAEGRPAAKKATPAKAAPVASATVHQGDDLSGVIREPRITEKATMLSERGAYVFDVHKNATKPMIATAIKRKYGVTPTKVRILSIPAKRRQSRQTGVMHAVGGGRKAIVTLKKGDKIEFV